MADELTLRTALKAAIDAAAITVQGVALVTTEVYLPRAELEALATPHCRIVPVPPDREQRLTRSKAYEVTFGVQVDLVQRVVPTDIAQCDALVAAAAELRRVARNLTGYDWQETRFLKDANNVPFDFVRLSQEHIWQTVFQPMYLAGRLATQ